MASRPDPRPSEDSRGRNAYQKRPLTLAVVFVLAVLGVSIAGRLYFVNQQATILTQKAAELTGVRDLKIDEIQSLRANLRADGEMVSNDPAVRDEIQRWIANPRDSAGAASIRSWLDSMARIRQYQGITLMTADGTGWIGSSGQTAPNPRDIAVGIAAMASREATLSDLYLEPSTATPHWDVAAPISWQRTVHRSPPS